MTKIHKAKTKSREVQVIEVDGIDYFTMNGVKTEINGNTHFIVKTEEETVVMSKEEFALKYKMVKPKTEGTKKVTPLAFIKYKGLEAEFKEYKESKVE